MNEEFDIRKIKHPYPSLEYMMEKNKGMWPIPWVSVKGLPDILSKLGDNLVGCEVGTYQGWSLVYLLNNTSNISQIYAIDPFTPYDDTPTGGALVTQEMQDYNKGMWHINTEQFSNKLLLIHKSASDAVDQFNDSSLDFIFIDGDHNYEAVKTDMNLYYKKIKSGGIFSGHDYAYATNGDVSRAVHEFMKENNIDENLLQFCETDVWYWVKP